jgi:hypothetical protein
MNLKYVPSFIHLLATKGQIEKLTGNVCICTLRSRASRRVCKMRTRGHLGGQECREWSERVRMRQIYQRSHRKLPRPSQENNPGPRQHSHSRARVPRDSWPNFTVSDLRLPKPGRLGPPIYIPQEQGGPVIPPGTGLHFRRPPTTRRATVEVFDPASTRDLNFFSLVTPRHEPYRKQRSSLLYLLLHEHLSAQTAQKTPLSSQSLGELTAA